VNTRHWFILESPPGDGAFNMAVDEALLECAPDAAAPVLRFYGWTEPAASFGYSQKYASVAALTLLRPLVRRPTGGGLVPHDADWTYSLAFPPGHLWYHLKARESYERVHQWVSDAFAKAGVATSLAASPQKEMPGQCFVGAEQFDVLWHGRKIAGAAQRRTRAGLLIQGSVQPPPIPLARATWQTAMQEIAAAQSRVQWAHFAASEKFNALVERLRREKYAQEAFNQRL
jgi:lipoate-protein ligase A